MVQTPDSCTYVVGQYSVSFEQSDGRPIEKGAAMA
jgi:hypothetical protein